MAEDYDLETGKVGEFYDPYGTGAHTYRREELALHGKPGMYPSYSVLLQKILYLLIIVGLLFGIGFVIGIPLAYLTIGGN